ncbi:uncharacterized protein LOC128720403 [Anopheles nili]|uniref:uncharacterized protein LOC128720403 n=1 Tax=Anopheles nili TaxID=185578 RepID=UPI00237C37AB|nr:uncharacterized protein LOC128720403 [Anopheles nili]
MDKSSYAAKRRQDKFHKSAHPPNPAKQKSATPKETPAIQHTAPLVVVDSQRYKKRDIQQNWSEEQYPPSCDSDSDDEQLQAADFEHLLELPPSSGGHFLLSTEKHWLNSDTELPGEDQKNCYSDYFRIDTKLLNASFSCIPFYERHQYEQSLFTTLELNLMRQKSELNTRKYQQAGVQKSGAIPSEHSEKMSVSKKPQPVPCLIGKLSAPKSVSAADVKTKIPDPAVEQNSDKSVGINTAEAKMSRLTVNPNADSADVKRVPIDSVKPAGSKVQQSSAKETKEDIQQWLDDILEI